ncbi:MAG TPA: ATP-dependent DNA helicase [Pseudonocardia sp.]|nr:ATP-dependent DNA helicase [Pseudonocardia sp.]
MNRPMLVRGARPESPRPRWDEAALRVLAHQRGPLRVLGGPGTGKTTLLLESVLRRVNAGTEPEHVLVLVGSRRTAAELRERITAGMRAEHSEFGVTVREPLVRTVHSYAFGLLRLHAARHGAPPPRLLAGAEQDAVVRELLAGELAGDVPGSGWPDRLRPALGIPGFAAELRELLLRAAERGVGPDELAGLGSRLELPEWEAAGRFFLSYEQVTLLRGAAGSEAPQATAAALDAAELVAAALDALAADRDMLDAERRRVRHLVVDDAQDLDPQQMRLVRMIGDPAETFLLAGDPDQAVLGFRGADPSALRDVDPDGRRTAVLTRDHRAAAALRTATVRVAEKLPGAGPGRTRCAPPGPERDGVLAVRVFSSAAQEAGWVADRLRRAHLNDGVPWSDMAVLVRSTVRSLPVLRRALLAAGVPMSVPADDLPLSRQPAVVPLLLLLRCAARPEEIDPDAAVALLSSPLGAVDPLRLRRLRRGLLRMREAGAATGESAEGLEGEAGSDQLLVAVLRAGAEGDLDPLTALPARDTAGLRKVARLLAVARAGALEAASAEEVLWRIWQASGLGERWAQVSAQGGPAGAQADRDLDAVVALFEACAGYTDRLPGGGNIDGFADYVANQRIPGSTLAQRAPQGESVSVMTAHAARGREWRVVAVPAVQEGSWPDLRLRGTLLGVERLVDTVAGVGAQGTAAGADGWAALSRTAPLLAEERRLFYVACTRARDTLLVSGVRGEEEQPSRFLDELEPTPEAENDGVRPVSRPPRALVLAELVGELRRAVCGPDSGADPGRRVRAAVQLARLAEAGVPGAHPDSWYGLAETSTDDPLRDPDQPAPVSPSDVEKIMKCPLRWALERHGGDDGAALPSVTGTLVHALVQASAGGAGEAEIEQALRQAWAGVDAGAPWFSRRELDRVRGMLSGFRRWFDESRAGADRPGLTQVAVEQDVELALAAGPEGPALLLRGRVDRLEVDAEGRPVIVDVKTSKTAVSKDEAAVHPQLAVYQLAAALGAFGEVLDGRVAQPGGGRLLFLADRSAKGQAKERFQPGLAPEELDQWRQELHSCAAATRSAAFEARENGDCERCPVRTSCPLTDDGRGVPG